MRVINFNAGPAGLPLPALERARDELLDFEGSGMSIMEHSHRGEVYEAVHAETTSLLTELLSIPKGYRVLFLTGGASQQFAQVPMNFLPAGASADYLMTGIWSDKALAEAQILGKPRVAATTREPDGRYTRLPRPEEIHLDPQAAYVHITSNNTVFGTQWETFPDTGKVPLIADMSSDFLAKKMDVSRFQFIYAGAQKNLGPSGLLIAVAHEEQLARGRTDIPTFLRYSTHAKNDSLYNTPPTFAIYLCRNVLRWAKEVGGVAQLERWNREKGALLYQAIDQRPDFYRAPVERASRSFINVVFRLPTEALETRFVSEAAKAGMVGLKGHRITGGIRASLYNAVTVEQVKTLVSFMEAFAQAQGGA